MEVVSNFRTVLRVLVFLVVLHMVVNQLSDGFFIAYFVKGVVDKVGCFFQLLEIYVIIIDWDAEFGAHS